MLKLVQKDPKLLYNKNTHSPKHTDKKWHRSTFCKSQKKLDSKWDLRGPWLEGRQMLVEKNLSIGGKFFFLLCMLAMGTLSTVNWTGQNWHGLSLACHLKGTSLGSVFPAQGAMVRVYVFGFVQRWRD